MISLACLCLLGQMAFAGDPSPHVALSHGIYAVIDRFEARGWFDRPVSSIRPFTRQ